MRSWLELIQACVAVRTACQGEPDVAAKCSPTQYGSWSGSCAASVADHEETGSVRVPLDAYSKGAIESCLAFRLTVASIPSPLSAAPRLWVRLAVAQYETRMPKMYLGVSSSPGWSIPMPSCGECSGPAPFRTLRPDIESCRMLPMAGEAGSTCPECDVPSSCRRVRLLSLHVWSDRPRSGRQPARLQLRRAILKGQELPLSQNSA